MIPMFMVRWICVLLQLRQLPQQLPLHQQQQQQLLQAQQRQHQQLLLQLLLLPLHQQQLQQQQLLRLHHLVAHNVIIGNTNSGNIPVGGDVITYYSCIDGSTQSIALSFGDPTGTFCNCDTIANPTSLNGNYFDPNWNM